MVIIKILTNDIRQIDMYTSIYVIYVYTACKAFTQGCAIAQGCLYYTPLPSRKGGLIKTHGYRPARGAHADVDQ